MITGKVNLIDLFNSMDEEEKEEFVKILIDEINKVQKEIWWSIINYLKKTRWNI